MGVKRADHESRAVPSPHCALSVPRYVKLLPRRRRGRRSLSLRAPMVKISESNAVAICVQGESWRRLFGTCRYHEKTDMWTCIDLTRTFRLQDSGGKFSPAAHPCAVGPSLTAIDT